MVHIVLFNQCVCVQSQPEMLLGFQEKFEKITILFQVLLMLFYHFINGKSEIIVQKSHKTQK